MREYRPAAHEAERPDLDLDPSLTEAADRAAAVRLSRAVAAKAVDVDESSAQSEALARDGLSGRGGEIPYRAEMESKFGTSFAGVRAHTGPEAAAASKALGAEAYTFGAEVGFRDRAPSRETVAHELTHVVQQGTRGAGSVAHDEAEARGAERPSFVGVDVRPGAMNVAPVGGALRMKRESEAEVAAPAEAHAEGGALLDDARIASAIAFNNGHWKDPHRAQITAFLRGGGEGGEFGKADVLAIAKIQLEEGGEGPGVDGKLGKGSTATLLRRGLVLDEVEVKPNTVKLIFYPGEFEDLKAWQAAKDQSDQDHAGEAGYNQFRSVSQKRPPGHGTIYVEVGGNIVDAIEARGGPPVHLKDGTHSADPSQAGSYKLGAAKSHVTSAWMYSQIAWGAPIREHDGEIQFKNPGADWVYATGPQCKLRYPFSRYDFQDSGGELMKEWRLNDFGETAFQIQGSPGLYVHTSPDAEEAQEVGKKLELTHSHGCLHVHPEDRDRLMAAGYLQQGVTLTIKKYTEALDLGATNKK